MKKRIHPTPCLLLCLLGLAFGGMACRAAEKRVSASLEPSTLYLGQAALLSLVVEGSANASAPVIPPVDGLEFRSVGQSTQLQFSNGVMSGGITYLYQVIASRTGDFSIPEIAVQVDGTNLKSIPIPLKVLGSPGKNASAPAATTPSVNAAASQPASQASDPGSQVGGIQLILPKRDFYVGELIPTDMKVYLREGLEIARVSLPVLSGDAFTMSKLGEHPERSQEVVNGRQWTVLTWHTAVSAVKAGEHSLGAKMGCTLLVVAAGRRSASPFDDFFNDPFFDNFFQRKEEKDVTLSSREFQVRVVPLPEEGRPSDFSGAIGEFQLNPPFVSAKEVMAGDPVTVKSTILGTGNFDRAESPQLTEKSHFRVYPPNAKFEPTDEASFAGQKSFEQILIPQSADIQEIPPLSFSYFDPEQRKYVTLSTDPVPLHVEPAKQDHAAPVIPLPVASNAAPHRPKPSEQTDLVGNKLELSRSRSFDLVVRNPLFWTGAALPFLMVLGLAGKTYRGWLLGRNPALTRRLSAHREIRKFLAVMEKSVPAENTAQFFEAAREALKQKLGDRFACDPASLTLAQIEVRPELAPEQKQQIRSLLETADAVLYSGQQFNADSLAAWKPIVYGILKELDRT